MPIFVLMQMPDVSDPIDTNKAYCTIGLKELHPGRGFARCNEFGEMLTPHPATKKGEDFTGNFAFLTTLEAESFKGAKYVKNSITFGQVFYNSNEVVTTEALQLKELVIRPNFLKRSSPLVWKCYPRTNWLF